MHSSHIEIPPLDTFTVVTWNILLDKTRTKQGLIQSQSNRAPSLASTLHELRDKLGTELDVIGLQEVHEEITDERTRHNGEFIAQSLGYGKGHWIEHNIPNPITKTGRKGEHVGFTGARVDHVETIELGNSRRAAVTHVGGTAVVNLHPRAFINNKGIHLENIPLQKEQVEIALDYVANEDSVAFTGDINNWLGKRGRRVIEDQDFQSVFTVLGRRHAKTYPTRAYRKAMYGKARYIAPSVVLDHIFVRGLEVYDAGRFIGDTDHAGLWAKLGTRS